MTKTWGRMIWEEKSKNQSGIGVSGGVMTIISGKKKYLQHQKKIQNEISSFLKKHSNIKEILEIGPGPDAINAQFLVNKGYELDIVDCSPNTLKLVKEKIKNGNVNLFEQDMIELDLKKRYDLVFCLGTFLHCPAHLSIILMNNFNKHLKEGGHLIIDFAIKNKMTLKKGLWEGFYSLGHRLKKRITKKDFYVTCAEYTLEELSDLFKRTGFKFIQKDELWILQKR